MKKKVLAILLFSSLILPVVVTYLGTQHRISVVKKETKQLLAKTNFEKLINLTFSKLDAQQLNWEHEDEFEYQNKMYDIIHQRVTGDSVYYTCWLDREETELNTKLKTLLVSVYQNDIPLQKQKLSFYQFYKTLFYYECKNFDFLRYNNHVEKKINFISSLYQFLSEKSLFHPPNIFSC